MRPYPRFRLSFLQKLHPVFLPLGECPGEVLFDDVEVEDDQQPAGQNPRRRPGHADAEIAAVPGGDDRDDPAAGQLGDPRRHRQQPVPQAL